MIEPALKDAIEALVHDGRLTAAKGRIHLDGDPVGEKTLEATTEFNGRTYRADGYSVGTSNGCRRHIDVDTAVDDLLRGDAFAQQAAENAYVWFCFDPAEGLEHLESDSPNEAADAAEARFNSRPVARFLAQDRDFPMDFRLRRDGGNWLVPDRHAVVYSVESHDEVAERWPSEYVQRLYDQAESLRKHADLNWP